MEKRQTIFIYERMLIIGCHKFFVRMEMYGIVW